MRVVYISGYGRSGSTILEMALTQNFNAFGGGELCNLFLSLLNNEHCECGEPIEKCPFWSTVLQDVAADVRDNRAEWHAITRKGERLFRTEADLKTWSVLWGRVLAAISEKSGCDVIIDSSKTTRHSANRIHNLAVLCDRVDEIHLIRHPEDVMKSVKKGSNQLIEAGKKNPVRFGGGLRAGISWYLSNYRVLNDAPLSRSIPITYEQYVNNFDITLSELESKLSLYRRAEEWPVGHGVSGNRVRRSGQKVEIKKSEKSPVKLNFVERRMARLLTSVYKKVAS